jgi:hypothetical protein
VVIAGRIIYDTLGPVVGRGRPDGILIGRAKGAMMERKRLDIRRRSPISVGRPGPQAAS